MNKNTKITIYVVVIVLVLLAIVWIFAKIGKKNPVSKTPAPTYSQVQPVSAAKGQLIDNIPQGTVEQGNTVNSSFKLMDGKTGSYTTEITSTKSVQDEYNYYTNFLKSQKLSVASETYSPAQASIFAYDQNQNVNVTITKQSKGTSILITYTK